MSAWPGSGPGPLPRLVSKGRELSAHSVQIKVLVEHLAVAPSSPRLPLALKQSRTRMPLEPKDARCPVVCFLSFNAPGSACGAGRLPWPIIGTRCRGDGSRAVLIALTIGSFLFPPSFGSFLFPPIVLPARPAEAGCRGRRAGSGHLVTCWARSRAPRTCRAPPRPLAHGLGQSSHGCCALLCRHMLQRRVPDLHGPGLATQQAPIHSN